MIVDNASETLMTQKEKNKLYKYFDFQSKCQSKLVMEKLMNLILRIINKQKCHFKTH